MNFVQAAGLVIFDPLPDTLRGTALYPTNYMQDDDAIFVAATGGGQYWPGPGSLLVNGVSIPSNSVY